MCKLKSEKIRLVPASVCISALIGLFTSVLPMQNALADCNTGFTDSMNISELFAHVNDTIHFRVHLNADDTICNLSGGTNWVVLPDGTAVEIVDNFTKSDLCTAPLTIDCPGGLGCIAAIPNDGLGHFTYVIKQTDVGKTNTFTTPRGDVIPPSFSGKPGKIFVVCIADADAFDCADPSVSKGIGSGSGGQPVTIVTPHITVTKDCDTNCTPYGLPIGFHGQVCNDGDILVGSVTVTNTPNGGVAQQVTDFDQFTTTNGVATAHVFTNDFILRPGECIVYHGTETPSPSNKCGPLTDTVVATATDILPAPSVRKTVTATASATCCVSTAPHITLTKTCQALTLQCTNDHSILVGGTYTETFSVTNDGNVPLQNVIIKDIVTKGSGKVTNSYTCAALLGTNDSCTITITNGPVTVADCGPITDSATATADNTCPLSVAPCDCPNPQHTTSNEAHCQIDVCCRPSVQLEKLVACKTVEDCKDQTGYSKVANGVQGAPDPTCNNEACPTFCYKVKVTNNGEVDLINVKVTDDNGTPVDTSDDFVVGTIPLLPKFDSANPGANKSTNFYSAIRCAAPTAKPGDITTITNTATVVGQSAIDSSPAGTVTTNDTAKVNVTPISVSCAITLDAGEVDMDGSTVDDPYLLGLGLIGLGSDADDTLLDNNNAQLPAGFTGDIYFNLYLKNPSLVDLDVTVKVTATDTNMQSQLTNCMALAKPIKVPATNSATPVIVQCKLTFDHCPAGSVNVKVTGAAVATVPFECVNNSCGHAITTSESACPASISCVSPVTCRTTGGGTLIDGTVDQSCIPVHTTISPLIVNGLTVEKITHGGQLGAPFSQMDCGAILGNLCIRGQWQHTRHYQGRAQPRDEFNIDFHSTTPKGVFDSLTCFCLGCCDPASGAFIPPETGPLIKKFQLCNPDDHKVCGPQPRPSPANGIIFSGIGQISPADNSGVDAKKARWVVFRVYIEDRSEPGGFHPGGAVEPSDIYCFQAWDTGLLVSKKPDYCALGSGAGGSCLAGVDINQFRKDLGKANCDFLNGFTDPSGNQPVGTLPSPTVNGHTACVQDCGPLHDGNHQIHPSTGATCDNPGTSCPTE